MGVIIIDGRVRASWLVSAPANLALPTAVELTAGSALEQLITPDGLNVAASTNGVVSSNLKSKFTTQRAGRRGFDVSIVFHHDDVVDLAYNLFTYQATGYLAIRRGIDATVAWTAGQKVEMYPLDTGERTETPPKEDGTWDMTVPFFLMADPNTRAVVA